MEIIQAFLIIVYFCELVLLADANWTAEGRVSLRFYKNDAKSFIQEPLESAMSIFHNTHYNRSLPLVILIHGMDASVDCEFVDGSVKAMYFRGLNKQFNIIALNLPELLAKQSFSDRFLYTTARNSKVAGEAVGGYLNEAIRREYISPDKIYVIGYSMGAQVAGYLGRTVRKVHGLIYFLMGLDPAGLGFNRMTSWVTKLTHVSSKDAQYTHFFHCNSVGWGTQVRDATANFLFNGGKFQPGCLADANLACSHNRVPFYFIESVLYPEGFLVQKCDSWDRFSTTCDCDSQETRYATFPPDLSASGEYFLRTNGHSPFGQHKEGIECLETRSKIEIVGDDTGTPEYQEKVEKELKKKAKHRRYDMTTHDMEAQDLKMQHNNVNE